MLPLQTRIKTDKELSFAIITSVYSLSKHNDSKIMFFIYGKKVKYCLCKFSWLSQWKMPDYLTIIFLNTNGAFINWICWVHATAQLLSDARGPNCFIHAIKSSIEASILKDLATRTGSFVQLKRSLINTSIVSIFWEPFFRKKTFKLSTN